MTAEGEERKEGKHGGTRRTSDVGSSLQLPVLAVYRAEEVEEGKWKATLEKTLFCPLVFLCAATSSPFLGDSERTRFS